MKVPWYYSTFSNNDEFQKNILFPWVLRSIVSIATGLRCYGFLFWSISPLLFGLETWFWCLSIGFGGQAFWLHHPKYCSMGQPSWNPRWLRWLLRRSILVKSPLPFGIGTWFWCLDIGFECHIFWLYHSKSCRTSQHLEIQDSCHGSKGSSLL